MGLKGKYYRKTTKVQFQPGTQGCKDDNSKLKIQICILIELFVVILKLIYSFDAFISVVSPIKKSCMLPENKSNCQTFKIL